MSVTRHLLVVFGGHAGGRTHAMVAAARQGIDQATEECGDELSVRQLPALEAGTEDLLWAHGLLLATPEHFGYMSGALKHFFDRTFYPVEGKVIGLPYALMVSAGNDGAGAVSSVERIALGYRWKKIAEPLVARGELTPEQLGHCRELGQLLAAGIAMDVF
jgi:multimeric flavodoxin WrbA